MVLRIAEIKKYIQAGKRKGAKPLESNPLRQFVQKNFRKLYKRYQHSIVTTSRLHLLYSKFPAIRSRYHRLASKDKSKLREIQEKTKNRGINGYSLFVKENFALKLKELSTDQPYRANAKRTWQRLSMEWKSLSKSRKERYKRRANQLHSEAQEYICRLKK